MKTKLAGRPTANVQWKNDGLNISMGPEAIPIYLQCADPEMKFSIIKAPFYPGAHPSEAMIFIVCPYCGMSDLRINGATKTFEFETLAAPWPILVPNDPTAVQTVRLNITESMGCPACQRMFRLVDSTMRRG